MANFISRREFALRSALAAGGVLAGSKLKGAVNARQSAGISTAEHPAVYNLMDEVRKYRKIDAYANAAQNPTQSETQMRYADRLHIEKLVLAVPVATTMGGSREQIRAYNDTVARATRTYPGRALGQFTVNPLDLKTAEEEIKRCLDLGMVGMKLFNHVKINHPSVYPVIEKFAGHKMIIHVHGESQLGVGGYRMKYDVKNNPGISVPGDFIAIAERYPEVMFQYAHIGGGSDWEYACKSFVNYPNIYVDTGGSNNEEYMVDFAVAKLGEDRVFFGCDGSFFQGVGKVLSSALTESQKRKVFFENYNNILSKSGNSIV
ncbi:MAG: amidohydrolase family protein [Daejeonella sp.]